MTTESMPLSYETVRHIERELFTYPDTKRHIQRRRNELAEGPVDPRATEDTGRRQAAMWSDPTAFRGSVLAEDRLLREMGRIVEAIEDVQAALAEPVRELLELWYFRRRSADACAEALHISRETAFRWRKGIVAAVAARLGWQ